MEITKDRKLDFAKKVNENFPELSGTSVVFVKQKKGVKLPQHIMLMQAFAYLACTRLKDSTNRVLMYFFGTAPYENYISMDVASITTVLNMSKRSVISALNELESNNIIIKIANPRDGRRHDYFLNPNTAWKGNGESREKAMSKLSKDQLSLFGEKDTKKITENTDFDNE